MKKTKLSGLFSLFASAVMALAVMGCSNVIEDLKEKENPEENNPYLTFCGNEAFSIKSYYSGMTWGTYTYDESEPFNYSYAEGKLEYSTDMENWTEWDGSDVPAAEKAGKYYIYFRGEDNRTLAHPGLYRSLRFKFNETDGGDTLNVDCTGNIMTLLDWKNPDSVEMQDLAFYTLFYNCTQLTTAPKLPATKLSSSCYNSMFEGCSLKKAPELPATTLAERCYYSMFGFCDYLEETPALPAAETEAASYQYMFRECKSLKKVGKISATKFGANDINGMFYGCSSLTVCETSGDDYFIKIDSTSDPYSVFELFEKCRPGSATAVVGKAYKWTIPDNEINGSVALSGKCVAGETLTATYTPASAEETFVYRWYRVDDSTEPAVVNEIADATSSTYTLTSDEIGYKVKVAVFGSDSYYGTKEALSETVVE